MTMPLTQSGRRSVTLTDIVVRADASGDVSVRGHAAVFDTPTMIGPTGMGFEEIIAHGAFRKTLADGADVRFLFNHNPDLVLARTKSGTLSLREDRHGLVVEARLAPTSVGRDLAVLLQRGDVSQMSFGFRAVKDRWATTTHDDGTSTERRTVLEAQLFDVSGVTYPAYDETDLALREAMLARELRDVRARQTAEPGDARAVSDKAWSGFAQADYTPEQWRRACLIDTGQGETDSKDRYKLPVREPDGPLNRNACHAAAARIGQVDVSADEKRVAARKLIALYRNDLDEDPPESLLELVGEGQGRSSQPAPATANGPHNEEIRDAPAAGGVRPAPEPAPATPHPDAVRERDLPLHDVLLRHAEGGHRDVPRLLCPACTQPATVTA